MSRPSQDRRRPSGRGASPRRAADEQTIRRRRQPDSGTTRLIVVPCPGALLDVEMTVEHAGTVGHVPQAVVLFGRTSRHVEADAIVGDR